MPKDILTETKLKNLKPKDKPYKVADGTVGGLHVAVSIAGGRSFRLAYKFEGKHQQLTLGSYPELSLAEARDLARKAKKQRSQGTSPAVAKKAEKAKVRAGEITFRSVACEWLALGQARWSQVHKDDTERKLELYAFPRFGDKPVADVGKDDIKPVLDTLQAQQKFPTLSKVRSILSQILQYAQDKEIPGVTADWTGQFRRQYSASTPQRHRAAITDPRRVKDLMKAIDAYEDVSLLTCLALKFSALTFCRPGEVRHAEWAEIDFERKLWRIPASKMKMKLEHLVPLATQTLELLEKLKPLSMHSKYLFPSVRSANNPMSEITVLAAIRRMGFTKEEMTAHGFRGMASTLLNEHGYHSDWIEWQLAHRPQDTVRASYNHAKFLEGRREMMQWWANYLDKLQMR